MADTVTIAPAPTPPAGKKFMSVDHDIVYVAAGDKITFYNTLETPVSKVTVKFYPYDKTKSDANAVNGFCTSMGAGIEFEVAQATGGGATPGQADCEVASSVAANVYQYSIDAQAPVWVDKDPVIIIEGGGGIVPMLPGFFAALIGAALGGALVMKYEAMKRKKAG